MHLIPQTYTQRRCTTTIDHGFHQRDGGCVWRRLECCAFPVQCVTTHKLLLPVRAVDEFVDQSLRVIMLPTVTHIFSLVYECGHGGPILACAKVWWSWVTRLGAMPNDCPKFRPVILDFDRDALVLQVKLMMLYISCHQETNEFLSWRAWE